MPALPHLQLKRGRKVFSVPVTLSMIPLALTRPVPSRPHPQATVDANDPSSTLQVYSIHSFKVPSTHPACVSVITRHLSAPASKVSIRANPNLRRPRQP